METHSDIFQVRLKEAIAPESLKQWCTRVGIPLSTINGAAQRKKILGGSTLLEISKITGRSIDWLLGGSNESPVSPVKSTVCRDDDWDAYVRIPFYDVEASAGYGTFIDTAEVTKHLVFRRDFLLRELRISHSDCYCVEAHGISMEPLLRDGHPVLIDPNDASIRREGPHLLRLESMLLLKNLQRLPKGKLRIWSENQCTNAYPSMEVDWPPAEGVDLEVLGRVRWSARVF